MIDNLSVLAIIPARGGSKGIPRKNIKMLGKMPLIAHTIIAAQKSKYIDHLHVSTEDEEIRTIAQSYGVEVPFLRDDKYAQDNIPNIPDVINCVTKEVETRQNHNVDLVLLLEPTYPFRSAETIDKVIEFVGNSNADLVATISKTREHPLRMRKFDPETNKISAFVDSRDLFCQRQEFNSLYNIKGAVYATRRANLFKDLNKCSWEGVVINAVESMDIDVPFDFKLAIAMEECFKNEN